MNAVTGEHDNTGAGGRVAKPSRLSYKFQRVREEIRRAIVSGELAGKLPGERLLSMRFGCNAKTLSKALTDLAAEGLVDRTVGRGTFVKGSAPATEQNHRWMVLCDADQSCGELIDALREIHPSAHILTQWDSMRPSTLMQYGAVVVLSDRVSEGVLRDLALRSIRLVLVNLEPKLISHHAVLMDAGLAGARIGRELLLAGHRRIAVVEVAGSTALVRSIRHTAARYAANAVAEVFSEDEVDVILRHRFTAIVCPSVNAASRVRQDLAERSVSVPGQVSLAAMGCAGGSIPCSGCFALPRQIAEAVTQLLGDSQCGRPAVLWLASDWRDGGTLGPGASTEISQGEFESDRFASRVDRT